MSLAEFDEIDFTHSCAKLDRPSAYLMKKARRNPNGLDDLRASYKSGTVYVGNLSFYTTEEQIYELFAKCGPIKQIIMGLDRYNFTPCGFCFVIYRDPNDAINAVKFLSDTKLEDRIIQIDLDPGFEEGRQFGRGASGGQVRDEYRFEYDSSRGGYGRFSNPTVVEDNNITNIRFGARRVKEMDTYIPGAIDGVEDEIQKENVPEEAFSNGGELAEKHLNENQEENQPLQEVE